MPDIKSILLKETNRIIGETIKIRRHLHKNPELSYKEYNTSEYISNYLHKLDIEHYTNIGGTGIIASIKGKMGKGKVIALRAELDALPIEEKTGVEYSSINKGVMHACGHDVHIAMLLSVAKILNRLREYFKGELVFIFQPGEEVAPGGATLILNDGTLRKLRPEAIIAQHVLPELRTGQLGFRAGKYMASSDEIYIDIEGTGGHAALPGASTEQVVIGSRLVSILHEKARSIICNEPLVLGFGKFIANGATNVIPDRVHIEGTLRTFEEQARKKVHDLIRETCIAEAASWGVIINHEIRKGYPVLINDTDLTGIAVKLAEEVVGVKNIQMMEIRMSSEDFAYYSHEYPVLFYRVGVLEDGEKIRNLHTAEFDIDEQGMKTGITFISLLAINLMNSI